MTASLRRPPLRWSKKTDQLVRHVALRCRPGFKSELGQWFERTSRFRDFVAVNQNKVRKKLNASDEEESRQDVRSELLVACLLLADRRFELAFEAYGARRLGPDLSVTFRANQRFNLEVTRLRSPSGPPNPEPETGVARLSNVISAKLRQLRGESPNALVITARGLGLTEESLTAAARLLKLHGDQKDDAFFARRGFENARAFHAQYLRLGGVFVLDEATSPATVFFELNREARHSLPAAAIPALTACLTNA